MSENPTSQPNQELPPIVDVEQLNQNLPEDYAVNKQKEEEGKDTGAEGGTGSVYNVPDGNFSDFRSAVLGHGYDIDNAYGWQCWDGAALLWQQFGKALLTGNGLAIGCWTLKRDANKAGIFDLVTKASSLKAGDVVVMRPNHIGFFVKWSGDYMVILGQNQGVGKRGPNGYGFAFTEVRIHKNAFAGAFRLKKWHKSGPKKTKYKTRVNVNIRDKADPKSKISGNKLLEKGKTFYGVGDPVKGGSYTGHDGKKWNTWVKTTGGNYVARGWVYKV